MSPADLDPAPGAAPAAPDAGAPDARAPDAEAWAGVLAAWEDEGAHRAYLARFTDLEGLTVAGRRYRAALEARPADPVAARWREEVLKRATVAGLAQLPRTAPPVAARPRRLLQVLLGSVVVVLLWLVLRLGGSVVEGVRAMWTR